MHFQLYLSELFFKSTHPDLGDSCLLNKNLRKEIEPLFNRLWNPWTEIRFKNQFSIFIQLSSLHSRFQPRIKTHSMNAKEINYELEKNMEVITQLDDFVGHAVDTVLVDPEDCWQPSDFLPDFSNPEAMEDVKLLQERASGIPDTVLTSLIGNLITEEALPSYQTYFNLLEGINPERSLLSPSGWVRWSKAWTAEENRHGDLLNKYLYLTGRVDMRAVEQTIHRLITNGFDPKSDSDPYQAMIYTSFQERATKISHVNTGKLADKAGDHVLSKICKTIAGDEARHEKAYKSFMSKIFEIDPSGAITAFEKMMRKNIVMPAVLMGEGSSRPSIYKDYLANLADRYMRLADRIKAPDEVSLAWLK
jgi:acyl-[acyl-carrier-protein] desaturase